jgi:hypothetical protein
MNFPLLFPSKTNFTSNASPTRTSVLETSMENVDSLWLVAKVANKMLPKKVKKYRRMIQFV